MESSVHEIERERDWQHNLHKPPHLVQFVPDLERDWLVLGSRVYRMCHKHVALKSPPGAVLQEVCVCVFVVRSG